MDKSIWFTILFLFSSSQREFHSVRKTDPFRLGTQLYMSLFRQSVHPSVCYVPYLRNHTSSNLHLWYTCVKWWYLRAFFFFFIFLKFWFFRLLWGIKGQKLIQNEKIILSATHWSWFLLHLCKMISPGVSFSFFIFNWSFHFSSC